MNIKQQLAIQHMYNQQVKASKSVLEQKNDAIDNLQKQVKKLKKQAQ